MSSFNCREVLFHESFNVHPKGREANVLRSALKVFHDHAVLLRSISWILYFVSPL
jgi:hypothetical protein